MTALRASSRMLFDTIAGFTSAVGGDGGGRETAEGAGDVWLEGENLDGLWAEEVDAAEEELAGLRAKVARLAEDSLDSREAAAAEIAALTAEVMLIESEKVAAEKDATERIDALRADLDRMRTEKVETERVTAEVLASLQTEVTSLAAEHALAPSSEAALLPDEPVEQVVAEDRGFSAPEEEPLTLSEPVDESAAETGAQLEEGAGEALAEPEEMCQPAEPADESGTPFSDGTMDGSAAGADMDPFAFLSDEASSEAGTGGGPMSSSGFAGKFAVDKSLDFVAIASAHDVLELYQSLNRARVAMEDHTTMTCDAFLCVVKEKGRPRVYIALYLIDAKSTLVYVPERQPVDEKECAKVRDEGMAFIEIVGFMMDRVDMGKDQSTRAGMIASVPVFAQGS
jgi:hypothetical protein